MYDNETGGNNERSQLVVVHDLLEKGINMPCKRKKEEDVVEQQRQVLKLFKMDRSISLSSPVKTEAKEMVKDEKEDFPAAVTTMDTVTSDGLKDLVSYQSILSTQQKRTIHLEKRRSSTKFGSHSTATANSDIITGDRDTTTTSSNKNTTNAAVSLSTTSYPRSHEKCPSPEIKLKNNIRDMMLFDNTDGGGGADVTDQPLEYISQSDMTRKKERLVEDFRTAVKLEIENEAHVSSSRTSTCQTTSSTTSDITSLQLGTLKNVLQTAESIRSTGTGTAATTAVGEGQQRSSSLSVITSSLMTIQSEKVTKRKVTTPRGRRELASLTEGGSSSIPCNSTPRRIKLGTISTSQASVRNMSKLGVESSVVCKGTAPMSPTGSATKRRRRSIQASKAVPVDKEDVQLDENSMSLPPWDPFTSAVLGGASRVRIFDIVKTPADTCKAIETLQYLRFLEGHRKDVICRVATPNAPLPLPHVFQSALGKVRMKLREIDRQLTYKEKELDAQQRRKENKMLFDEASCDSMALDAKVWDNPVSLVEAISKAKAVRQMLLAWSEKLPQTKQPQHVMKDSLQGSTKMRVPPYSSLSPPVNALYRHPGDLDSVAKILTFNRCLAMAAHSASMVHHHCLDCTLPHKKQQLIPTSPQLVSRVAKAVSRRKMDIDKKWESLRSQFSDQDLEWKSRISILEKRKSSETGTTTSTKGGSMFRDVVRSDYEQEQILVELMAEEAKELKIANGCTYPPAMLTIVERSQMEDISFGSVDLHWNTSDGERMLCEDFYPNRSCPPGCNCFKTMEKDARMENPWTDREKCIFLRKFLIHPKDFYAIARTLPNKQTHDVVAFYYDTKQYVDYKEVLKEHAQRVREKMRGIITDEKGGTGRWPATLSAANCMGTSILLTDPSDPTSLVFELPPEGLYTTLHAHPPAALATMSDIKCEALELSRKGVVRKIQAPLGLKGLKSGTMTTEQLDEVDISSTTLSLAAYHLALSLCPTLGRDPPPFRRGNRDVGFMSCTGSLVALHLCGIIETSSRGGTGNKGRGRKLRDGDYLCGRLSTHNRDSDEADLQLFLKNQSNGNSNNISSNNNAVASTNTTSGSQNLRRKNRANPSSPFDNSERSSGDVIRSGGQKWKEEEKEAFLAHFNQVGKDWLALAKAIPGKAPNQIKNYYQNYKVKLGLVEPAVKNYSNINSTNVHTMTTKTMNGERKDTKQLSLSSHSSSSTGRGGAQQQSPVPFLTTGETKSPSVVSTLDATMHHSKISSGSDGGGALVYDVNGHLTIPFVQCPTHTTSHYSSCSSSSRGNEEGYKLDQQGNNPCCVSGGASASDHHQRICSVPHEEQYLNSQYMQPPSIVRAEGEDHSSIPSLLPFLPIGDRNRKSYTSGERIQHTNNFFSVGGDGTLSQGSCTATSLEQCNIQTQPQHQQQEEGAISNTSKLDENQ